MGNLIQRPIERAVDRALGGNEVVEDEPKGVINTTRTVAKTVISLTQDVTQAFNADQIVRLDSGGPETVLACNKCLALWRRRFDETRVNTEAGPDGAEEARYGYSATETQAARDLIAQDLCANMCRRQIDNVDLSQVVSVDFTALLEDGQEDVFVETLLDNLFLGAHAQDLNMAENQVENVQTKARRLFQTLVSARMQEAFQSLRLIQTVQLKGPGVISAVTMAQMVDMISGILQSTWLENDQFTRVATDFRLAVAEISTQVVLVALQTAIGWVILAVLMLVALALLLFILNQLGILSVAIKAL